MSLALGNVAVAQGGGPTAVINRSLYGIVTGIKERAGEQTVIWGARGGIAGVLNNQWIDLTALSQDMWEAVAGSAAAALGSCRKRLNSEEAERVVETFAEKGINHLLEIRQAALKGGK